MSRLKELREEKNWTQKYIGSVLNVKNAAISKYETGRAALTEDTIILLAKLFNVSSDYLLGLSNIRSEFRSDANNNNVLNYSEPVYNNISLNETSGFPSDSKNNLNKDEANVLFYYNRLSDENKDYIKGKMIDLYREQISSMQSPNLNPDTE